MYFTYHDTAIGPLLLAGDGDFLREVRFAENGRAAQADAEWTERAAPFASVRKQLDEYFARKRTSFDLQLAPSGTPFQLQVLAELQRIPYGETRSYSDVARAIGRPSAQRAVGAANGRNPIPIIIPCHRVIGRGGDLVGFGGGLPIKRYLLELEGGSQGSLAFARAG